MAEYKHLLLAKEGPVAILTLNRANQFNTLGPDVWREMEQVERKIEAMEDLRAVIINAAGPHFSAGIDLNVLGTFNSEVVMKTVAWSQSVYSKWEELSVPVIAAVQGLCYGSGTELILACDIRIAARNARIAIPEVRFGLAPDMGGTTRLTKLVGAGQAKRMIIACEEVDAEEAKSIGLVEKVVDNDKLMEEAMKLAQRIADMPPVAVKMAKKGINLAVESSRMAGLLFEQAQTVYCCGTRDMKEAVAEAQTVYCCGTRDMKEAVAAFFEKRKPTFEGR